MEDQEQRFQQFESVQHQLSDALNEITRLNGVISTLQKKLAKYENDYVAPPAAQNSPSVHPTGNSLPSQGLEPKVAGTEASTWATVAARPASRPAARQASRPARPARKARTVEAALRAFQPMDPEAPKGFGYLYVPRARKLARSDVRRRLRTIGIDTSRVLDICFPARGVMGLLVHAQYAQSVIDIFGAGKVPVDTDLDPTNPSLLEDPKFKDLTPERRAAAAIQVHANRCLSALRRLRVDLIPAVGHSFVENGWIAEEDVADVLAEVRAGAPKKRKSPP
ncbi:hypothetical protein H4R35_007574, partial [Dimargaris xerosporica]